MKFQPILFSYSLCLVFIKIRDQALRNQTRLKPFHLKSILSFRISSVERTLGMDTKKSFFFVFYKNLQGSHTSNFVSQRSSNTCINIIYVIFIWIFLFHYWLIIVDGLRSNDENGNENVTWKWWLLRDYCFFVASFIVDNARCNWTGRSAVEVNVENERLTVVC